MFRVVSPGGLRLAAATVGLAAAIVLVVFNAAPHVSLEQTALAAGVGAPVQDTGGIPTLSLSTGAENLHPVQKSQAYRLKDSLRRLLGRIRASSNVARRHASRQAKHFAKYLADPRFAAYADEGHHAPYDFHMEKDEWTRIARDFRATHPGMAPKTEQRRLNAIWREVHPYFYHAKGPRRDNVPASDEARGREGQRGGRATVGRPGGAEVPLVPVPEPDAPSEPLPAAGEAGGELESWSGPVPATILAPPDDGIRDFDGQQAVDATANLPQLGDAPSPLDEHARDARGSFCVKVMGASGSPELDIERCWGSVATPFRCTYRGYRRLQGDFAGTTILTGFKRVFTAPRGERRITTGLSIPPSGARDEFDIMTCRDLDSGEVQYFKLTPRVVLTRMRRAACAGATPAGSIGDCVW